MATESGADDSNTSQSQNQNPQGTNAQQGAKPPPKRDPVLSARDELLEKMDRDIEAQWLEDDEKFFQSADPRALALAVEMGRESRGERISMDRTGQGSPEDVGEAEPGTQEVDPVEPTGITPRDAQGRFTVQVDAAGNDPLADYVVREDGKPPMFKTVVDGKVRLIPLESARAQLQKHLAADQRLQQAAARGKEQDARDLQLRQREAALTTRALQPVAPVDDATLEREATEVVRSLVSEPEATAAKKLAAVLKARMTPAFDVNAVVKQAVVVAKQEIAAENHQKALMTGLSEFETSYPEMKEKGSELYLIADSKTDAIAAEHPEWTPSQVMMEAGKQTREWVQRVSGKPAPKVPNVQLSQSRQQVKEGLKPMPQSRSVRPAPADAANEDNSPQAIMAETRKARGQWQ